MTQAERRTTSDREDAMDPLLVGAAAGLIGGLVASWLMVQFQERVWPPPEGSSGSSTGKLARKVAALSGAEPLTDERAEAGGELIHYALGAGLGLAYGAATEVVINQALVPVLGIADPFRKYPVEIHARGRAAHLVFGIATDLTRRVCLRPATLGVSRGSLLP